MMHRRWTLAATAVLLAAVMAGCSTGSKQTNPDPGQPPASTSNQPTPTTPTQPAGGTTPAQPGPGTSKPVTTPGQPGTGGAFDLPGSHSELAAALAEPSDIIYQIVVAGDIGTMDKDTYLDRLLAERKWPEANMLVLVVYDKANYDIRFAMGSIFSQRQVKVDEILALVRTHYLKPGRAEDPAAAMADFIRAVNGRLAR